MSIDRRKESVDFVLENLASSNKRTSILTYAIAILSLTVFATTFYLTVERLNNELTTQIDRNEEMFSRIETLEGQLKKLGRVLYNSQEISKDVIESQRVEDVIAKEVNRRQLSDEEKEALKAFEVNEASVDQKSLEINQLSKLVRAANLVESGQLEPALPLVEEAIYLNDRNAVAYALKAQILYEMKAFREAISAQTKAIDIEKLNVFSEILPNYYNTRGFLYLELNQFDQAISDFSKGASIAVGDEKAFIGENVILSYLLQGKWQDAFNKSNEILALHVDGGWKWFLRAISAHKLNDQKAFNSSLQHWYQETDEYTISGMGEVLDGTVLESYTKFLRKT